MNYVLVYVDKAQDDEPMVDGGIVGAFETKEEAIVEGKKCVNDHPEEDGYIVSVVDLNNLYDDPTVLQDD